MADIFQKGDGSLNIKSPITADKCTITFDGTVVADAIQFQCNYQQQIIRRRSIGNQSAIIYSSMPMGSISVARLLTDSASSILGTAAFTCKGGTVSFSGTGCDGGQVNYTARGVMVQSYSISANADDMSVMDNITFEFIELTAS